jgi:Flp pilus assembly pilin Flp
MEKRPPEAGHVEVQGMHHARRLGRAIAALSSQRGQTMAEYTFVVSIIVIAVVATLTIIGVGINTALSSVTRTF